MFDFPGGQLAAFCVTFAIGGAGYLLFCLLRLPSPALLGSMVVTGVLNATGFYPEFPVGTVSFITNALIGIMLGKHVNRGVFGKMRVLAFSVFIQLAGMLVLSLISGCVVYALGASRGVSLITALISGTAGGIAEMMIFGMSMHADLATVAFMHVFRFTVFLWMIPYILLIAKKIYGKKNPVDKVLPKDENAPLPLFAARDYALMTIFAFIGSAVGYWLRIPTGAMLGATVGGGAFTVAVNKRYNFNLRLGIVAQIGLGLVLGQRVTPQIVSQAGALLISAVLLTLIMLICSIFLALLLYKMSDLDMQTCLLCTAPAGLNQIPIFAEEIGADAITASIFHTVRLLGIVSLYPWIIMPLL